MFFFRAGDSSSACSITDFERPVLRDQLPRGLVADPGNARDVVRGVALQADEVRHLVRPHAVAQLDPLGRVDVDVRHAARRHHQADVRRAELEGVAVGRDDAGLDARLVRAGRQRRDHVVRLPALELEVAVAERLDDRAEVRELLAQEVRHRPAALLVDDVRRLRDGRPVRRPRVPRNRDAARLVVGEQLEEHVREAEERVRRKAVACRELFGEGEEGAIGEVVAVDEEELGLPCGAVVELQLLACQRLRHTSKLSSRGDGTPRDSSIFRRVHPGCRRPARGASSHPPGGRAAPARAVRGSGRRGGGGRGARRLGACVRLGRAARRARGRLPARHPQGRRSLGAERLGRAGRPCGRRRRGPARPLRGGRRAVVRGGPRAPLRDGPCVRGGARRRLVARRLRPAARARDPRGARRGVARRASGSRTRTTSTRWSSWRR